MILSGRFITADEAYQYGLVAQVVGPVELLGTATALAQRLLLAPPGQVRRLLEIYDDGEGLQRKERLELARRVLLETQLNVQSRNPDADQRQDQAEQGDQVAP